MSKGSERQVGAVKGSEGPEGCSGADEVMDEERDGYEE
jgi:hypothetical protein